MSPCEEKGIYSECNMLHRALYSQVHGNGCTEMDLKKKKRVRVSPKRSGFRRG